MVAEVRQGIGLIGVLLFWSGLSVSGEAGNTGDGLQEDMVLVPAGEFLMGSEAGDEDERPAHTVFLDAFWIDRYEVTNAAWNRYARVTEKMPKSAPDGYPVVRVNWFDAQDYCEWAGKRLPTEAEWEKAARGTDGRTYPWGEGIARNRANYQGGATRRQVVGTYPEGVSPFGLHDMAGNVREWVADWYGSGYYATSPERNPEGPVSGTRRILRGGAWCEPPAGLRSTDRFRFDPIYRNFCNGFRCAKSR